MDPENATPWPGWTPQKTLVLPIPADKWPPPTSAVVIDGLTFEPKSELHVTLIGRGIGQSLHGEPGGRRAHRLQDVREAFADFDWEFAHTGLFLRLEKRELPGHGRGRAIGSIIERIEMPALAAFYDVLAHLLERGLSIPPPHVTLYTTGRARGIGIPDAATMQRLTVREVEPSELAGYAPSADHAAARDTRRH